MFITGPDVIKTVTGEEVDFESLGGAMSHNSKSGVAHFASDDEDACLEDTRYLLSFLPQNNLETPPRVMPSDDPMRDGPGARPRRPRQPEQAVRHARRGPPDRRRRRVLRGPRALRAQHRVRLRAARRLRGRRRRQPARPAGRRARHRLVASRRARFVRTCDAFNIPIITFCDVPGFLPGTAQEWGGIIRHGAKLLYAYTEATVPKITIITRKAYGGAYDVMASKHMLADFNFAWPTAEVAVMGPEGAVNIIYRRDIASSPTPGRAPPEADRRLQGALRQPVRRGRARLHRRRDRAPRDASEDHHGARDAADQARRRAQAQARQHPALAGDDPLSLHAGRSGATPRSAAAATARSWIARPVESNSVTASGSGRPGRLAGEHRAELGHLLAARPGPPRPRRSARRRARPAPTRRRTARTRRRRRRVASALPGPSAPSMLRCRPGPQVAGVDHGLGAGRHAADDVAGQRLLARARPPSRARRRAPRRPRRRGSKQTPGPVAGGGQAARRPRAVQAAADDPDRRARPRARARARRPPPPRRCAAR